MRTSERKRRAFNFKTEAQRSIRLIRRELKLSQHELARKMVSDVDQSTISNWESGKSDIPLSKFIDILLLSSKDPASYFDSLRGKKKDDTEEVPE